MGSNQLGFPDVVDDRRLLLCGAIRFFGFVLQKATHDEIAAMANWLERHQFGLKHMMIWAAAMVPILLVLRGFNFLVLKRLGGPDLFPLVLVAVAIATVNLLAIWAVLGQRLGFVRLAVRWCCRIFWQPALTVLVLYRDELRATGF